MGEKADDLIMLASDKKEIAEVDSSSKNSSWRKLPSSRLIMILIMMTIVMILVVMMMVMMMTMMMILTLMKIDHSSKNSFQDEF